MTIAHEPAASASLRRGALAADALLEPWVSCLQEQLGNPRIFDCHTHLGCADPDGSCFDVDELSGALAAVDGRAVVFPLAEPGGYRAANDRMLAAAEAGQGRLVAFCRIDPHDGAVREVERAVGRGEAGIKLHPRAERFGLGDPAVRRIFALADERWLPIIVHAGRGIPSPGAMRSSSRAATRGSR
ncbi:MAG: amidohydrolase family protein [Solirubrobacteraceae bacterium]